MNYIYFTLQILIAVVLGGLIGWQRHHIGKSAGTRTYALVSMGSAMFTILALGAFPETDITRITAAIVTGIGFLGAGTILHKKETVDGLTTAAGFWVVAGIGMSVGVGWIYQAIIVSVITFLLLMMRVKK